MFKQTKFIYILLLLFLTTACDVNDNLLVEKKQLNFSINKIARNLLKQAGVSADLSQAKKAVISLNDGDVVKYKDIELNLINWGDGETFRTDIIEVEANINFTLTQFELRDGNDVTIFACPIEGAPFANLVTRPLPLPVAAQTNEQKAVQVEVLSTENSSPQDFGYPYFDVILKSKNAFSVVVKAEGKLVESKLKLSSESFVIEQDLLVGKNIIEFDNSFDQYELEVSKAGFISYIESFTKENLTGKEIIVNLIKQNSSTSSPDWSDYEITYVNEFPNENNTGINGVGLTKDQLVESRSLHIYNDGSVKNIIDGNYIDAIEKYPNNIFYNSEKNELIIENMNVYDGIYIYSSCNVKNVIIRKCYITDGKYGVTCENTDQCFITIEDCTIETPGGSRRKAILANNCIVKRCNISNYIDGIYFVNNVIIESNYIHDLYTFPGSHDDGIQGCGKNIIIVNNNIDARNHNACIMSSTQTGSLHNIWIEHNYMAGGAYIVYVYDKVESKDDPSYTLQNATVKNNILVSESYLYGYIAYTPDIGIVVSGNTDENGNILTINNQ